MFNKAANKFNRSDEYLSGKSQYDLISNSFAVFKHDSLLTGVSEDNGMLVDVEKGIIYQPMNLLLKKIIVILTH